MSGSVKFVVGSPEAMRYERRAGVRFDDVHALPSRDECVELANRGIERAQIASPLDAARDPRGALELIRFVRDALPAGITAQWTVTNPGALRPDALMHLPPPARFPGFEGDLERWRDFSFGVFYWRRGPGFVIVHDVRPGFDAAQYCIDDAACLAAFADMQQPVRTAHARERHGEAFETLASAGMLIVADEWAISLPYRIVTWPIPYSAI